MAELRTKSAAGYVDFGFAQVEPNHLSAQRTGQIYAQLPLATIEIPDGKGGNKTVAMQVENGQFVKYDYANEQVNLTGEGEWMLVYNEIKTYDARETAADFVFGGQEAEQAPRVFKTNVGDIMTTNAIKDASVANKAILKVDTATGFLATEGADNSGMEWQVAKVYDLADGQKAVKIVRIK